MGRPPSHKAMAGKQMKMYQDLLILKSKPQS